MGNHAACLTVGGSEGIANENGCSAYRVRHLKFSSKQTISCCYSTNDYFWQATTSGRFETLGAILNRDNMLFPYLRRCVEGRALRAMGPATEEVPASDGGSRSVVTLSGAVAQVVDPPRWPREVQYHGIFGFFFFFEFRCFFFLLFFVSYFCLLFIFLSSFISFIFFRRFVPFFVFQY
jgi:hypothetical protein